MRDAGTYGPLGQRLLAMGVMLVLSWPAAVLADGYGRAPLMEGERIRIATPSAEQPIEGRVLRADGSAIAVTRHDGRVIEVPRAAIERLEVVRGRRSYRRRGAIIGGIVGAGFILGGYIFDSSCPNWGDPRCVMYPAAISAASAALVGSVGAGIGSLIHQDRWVRLYPGRYPGRVRVVPTRRGVAFGVSVRF